MHSRGAVIIHTLSTVSETTTIIQSGEALQMLEAAYIQKKEKETHWKMKKIENMKKRE